MKAQPRDAPLEVIGETIARADLDTYLEHTTAVSGPIPCAWR
jgi:hypothetical protein